MGSRNAMAGGKEGMKMSRHAGMMVLPRHRVGVFFAVDGQFVAIVDEL